MSRGSKGSDESCFKTFFSARTTQRKTVKYHAVACRLAFFFSVSSTEPLYTWTKVAIATYSDKLISTRASA